MERKNINVGENKISISKIKGKLTDERFASDEFVLTPLIRFSELNGDLHITDGMVVGLVVRGVAKITVNGNMFELHPNSLFMLRDDSDITAFKCSKACMGYMIGFSPQFLRTINVNTPNLLNANLLFSLSPCIQAEANEVMCLHDLASMVGRIAEDKTMAYGDKVLSSLSNAFFYTLSSIINRHASDVLYSPKSMSLGRADQLMQRFANELAASSHCERSVEYYAAKLGITPKYLSLVCKKKTGMNASKVIDDAVIRRAKELLSQPGLSIQDVSERLNFVSQSFFGKYFKQRTGVSPSRYKA